MALFNFLGCCLHVLFFLLSTEIIIADRGFDVIETRFIENICPYNDTADLFLSATGKQSALRLKNMMTKGYGNCTIVIYSALTGVIVNLDAGPYRPDAVYEGCKDYIQLVPGYDKTRNCNDKVTSLVSEGNKIMFRFIKKYNGDYLERSCIILTTAYRRGNGRCSDNEFMCGSGECIWKEFQCDGQLNCPDGSDEYGPRSRICRIQVKRAPVTTAAPPSEAQFYMPETTPVIAKEHLGISFYLTLFAAIISSFLIFMFAIIRFLRKTVFCKNKGNANGSSNAGNSGDNNQSNQNHSEPRIPYATFRRITVIHAGYTPEKDNSSPPPSYRSTVVQNNYVNPPSYSAAVVFYKQEGDIPMKEVKVPEETDALLESDQRVNDGANPGPPPPYVP